MSPQRNYSLDAQPKETQFWMLSVRNPIWEAFPKEMLFQLFDCQILPWTQVVPSLLTHQTVLRFLDHLSASLSLMAKHVVAIGLLTYGVTHTALAQAGPTRGVSS